MARAAKRALVLFLLMNHLYHSNKLVVNIAEKTSLTQNVELSTVCWGYRGVRQQQRSVSLDFWRGLCVSSALLRAGDVKVSPGPVGGKYPCVVCGKAVRNNHLAIECSRCEKWTHAVCGGVSPGEYL